MSINGFIPHFFVSKNGLYRNSDLRTAASGVLSANENPEDLKSLPRPLQIPWRIQNGPVSGLHGNCRILPPACCRPENQEDYSQTLEQIFAPAPSFLPVPAARCSGILGAAKQRNSCGTFAVTVQCLVHKGSVPVKGTDGSVSNHVPFRFFVALSSSCEWSFRTLPLKKKELAFSSAD